MGTHDYSISNQTGAATRADINNVLAAIVSNNSSSTEPADLFAYMWWMDTSANKLKLRNGANTGWLEVLDFSSSTAVSALIALGSTSAAGLQFTGDANTGLYSAGADLVGLLAGGTELLRADGVLGYLKAMGTKGVLMPSGTTAQRPTGVAGLQRWNSDLTKMEVFNGVVWAGLGGGGGGAGFQWKAVSGQSANGAPTDADENGESVSVFGAGLSQELYATIKVPQSYVSGTQIFVYVSTYSASTSNTQLIRAQSTLIRQATDAFTSTTNQRTTTNSALTNSVANQLRQHVLDVTDSSGQINSVAVSAGDVVKVRLYRDTDTDTADLRMIPNSTDIKLS